MKNFVLIILALLSFTTITNAQNPTVKDSSISNTVEPVQPQKVKKDNRPIGQRLDFNIATSFWVNTHSVFFEFSPVIIYHFPKTYSIGTGPTYIYNREKASDVTLNGWGGKVFGQANFTSWLYGYTEYQGISSQYISGINVSSLEVQKSSRYVDSWFLSLGVNLPMGRRHVLNLQCLYDLLYDKDTSPYYSSVIYRIGFNF